MDNQGGKYNIKAVSKMLGIQPGTLRAWERRYNMIAPVRNESGHRLYTEEHIKILKWLMSKINKGFSISQAVNLLENTGISAEEPNLVQEEAADRAAELTDELLKALHSFDENSAHELLNKAFSLYSIDKVVIDILGTVLVKTGDLWEAGKITTAHEHFASSFLRSRIGMILHTLPVNGLLPKTVAVCGPGEWHEFGLLIFTLFLRRRGFEVIYLGTSIAEKDIEAVIEEVNPKFLILSCTLMENAPKTLNLVKELSEKYEELSIGLGGSGFHSSTNLNLKEYKAYLIGDSKNEWEEWLKNNLSRSYGF
ncbi:MerR family transcriptional regulator [Metabacillus sp. GX 13764]|uniref:MerR family transcriptional regulator n=1 Tax=Metabacillus kandeliae TaxID=2900151 RepID=UPI001E562CB2|nr:MerR family transcriptional regulator [Metabacillus kandeliae]MCD7033337.1 MerR family transcriptional regulator [Metabacillus kandeliae]